MEPTRRKPGRRPTPRQGNGKLQPLADLLPKIATDHGWDHLYEMAKLQVQWPQIVGDAVASHSFPDRLARGRLTVLVDNPTWMTQLAFFKDEIRRKVNSSLGAGRVGEVYMKVGRGDRRQAKTATKPQAPLSPIAIQQIDKMVAELADPDTRAALRRLMLRQIQQTLE